MKLFQATVVYVASDVGDLQVERTHAVLSCIFPHCMNDF